MSDKFNYYKEQREKYVARGVGNGNLHVADEAQSATIKDVEGNVFIDFAGAIGTLNVGHTHPEITKHLIRNPITSPSTSATIHSALNLWCLSIYDANVN